MFRISASHPGTITTLGIASLALRASRASRVSEHESHLNQEIVALSEGDHSTPVLGWDFGRIRRVMIEEKAGFVREDIPKGKDAELELGGPRGNGLVSRLAMTSCLIGPRPTPAVTADAKTEIGGEEKSGLG